MSDTYLGYDTDYDPLESSRMRTHSTRASDAPTSRQDLDSILNGGSGNSPLWSGVGYPKEGSLDFEDYWLRYERQGFARGIIDKPAHDTWQANPEPVDESTDDGSSDTQFEKDAHQLLEGETLRRKPIHRMMVADKLATLGEFSLIVLGFADGRDMSTPISGVEEDEDPEFDGLEDLEYLAVFGQDRVNEMETVTDMSDPRFRLPESYELIVDQDPSEDDEVSTIEVHWSRVIHVPQGTLENDLRGTPALKPIWNNLLNLEKILAGSAEGYWRAGFSGLVIRPPEAPGGGVANFEGGSDELAGQIQQWMDNFERTIATTGRIDTIDASVGDPEPHVNQQIKEIAGCKDFPQSVLMGNETGERATSEDKTMWHEFIESRRNQFADPVIATSLFDRLIATGILTPPSGDGYTFKWPDLTELTEAQEADVAQVLLEAIERASEKQPDRLFSPAELRQILGYDPEYGSEADGEFHPPDPEVDDLDEQTIAELKGESNSPAEAPAEMQQQMGELGDSSGEGEDGSSGPPGGVDEDEDDEQ